MKKLLPLLLMLCCFCGCAVKSVNAQTSLTPTMQFQLPGYGSSNWQVPINYDLQRLDSIFAGTVPAAALQVNGTVSANVGNFAGLQIGGSYGPAGYTIQSTGSGTQWVPNASASGLLTTANTWTNGNTFNSGLTTPFVNVTTGIKISGSYGTSGYVLSSTGTGAQWIPNVSGTALLSSNNTWSGTNAFGTATGTIFDASTGFRVNGSYGASGQVLASTGTGSQWITLPANSNPFPANNTWTGTNSFTAPVTIGSLSAGATTFTGSVTLPFTGSTQCLHIDTTGLISGTGADCGSGSGGGASLSSANTWTALNTFSAGVKSNTLVNAVTGYQVNGSYGTSGQVLQSTGSGSAWVTPASVLTTNNTFTGTNTFNSGLSATFANLTTGLQIGGSYGTNGYVLKSTGTGTVWAAEGTGMLATNNTWSGTNTFNTTVTLPVTGSTQCLHVNTSGVVSGTGSDCGSGGGATDTRSALHITTLTTTGTTTNVISDAWITASSECYVTPKNSAANAVTNISFSGATTGSITFNHDATSGATFAVWCSKS